MLATWDGVYETYQDQEEEANMCLNAEPDDEKTLKLSSQSVR